jgi:hypothetical protein
MTEAEWFAATKLDPMLAVLERNPSERKLRLFAAGCIRRIWHLLDDERSTWAVEVLERFVDGQADTAEMSVAMQSATAPSQRASTHWLSPEICAALAVTNAIASAVPGGGGMRDGQPPFRWSSRVLDDVEGRRQDGSSRN